LLFERSVLLINLGQRKSLQFFVFIRKGHGLGGIDLGLVLAHLLLVNGAFGGSEDGFLDQDEVGLPHKLAGEPQEGALKVVVGFGGDIVVLDFALFAVEGDLLGLDLAILNVDLVSAQYDGNILAHTNEIAMPVGDIFVCNAAGHIKENNGSLGLNVITIAKTSELLLPRGVPNVETDGSAVGVESERVNLHAERCDVLSLKLTREMTLHERGFSCASIAHENELKGGNLSCPMLMSVGSNTFVKIHRLVETLRAIILERI